MQGYITSYNYWNKMRYNHIRILLPLLLILLLSSNLVYADEYSDFLMEGNFHYKEKDYKKAVKAYEEAEKLALDTDINVYYNLGLAYRHIKDYPSSVESLTKYLKLASETGDQKRLKAVNKIVNNMSAALSKPTTSGVLKNYEIWEGWIRIDGDVIVPKNIVLTIKPGALIMFKPNYSKFDLETKFLDEEDTERVAALVIKGTLIAEGDKDNEILFSNSFEDVTTKKIGLWGGIIFNGSKNSVLKYAKVERANNGVTIRSTSNLVFNKNIFVKNEVSVKLLDKSAVTIDDSIFYRNDIGIEYNGFAEAKIIHCNFTKNSYAIKALNNAWPRITNNAFDENSCGVCTYGDTFSTVLENTFNKGTFGVSMTGKSKANIKNNKFDENKFGVNSVGSSMPRIEKNSFAKSAKSGVDTSGKSSAIIRANTFTENAVGISKVGTSEESGNTFEGNKIDVEEVN